MAVGKFDTCENCAREGKKKKVIYIRLFFSRLAMKIKFIVIYFCSNFHHEKVNLSHDESFAENSSFINCPLSNTNIATKLHFNQSYALLICVFMIS